MPRFSANLSVPCQLLGELANLIIVGLKLSTFANLKATLVASASNGMEVPSAVIRAERNVGPDRAPLLLAVPQHLVSAKIQLVEDGQYRSSINRCIRWHSFKASEGGMIVSGGAHVSASSESSGGYQWPRTHRTSGIVAIAAIV